MKKFILLLIFPVFIILLIVYVTGCSAKSFPKDEKIQSSFHLINQDSSNVTFPDDFKNHVVVMAFIYTHCPDVCPLTVNNMKLIQEKLDKDGPKNVDFVALSFDPNRDTPHVLKEYGDIRNINYSHFQFLTGKQSVIDSLIKEMDVIAIKGDTTTAPDGSKTYYMIHTDRISLIDQDGNIRKDYKGSAANIDTVVADVKSLI
jgi:protein SCO1